MNAKDVILKIKEVLNMRFAEENPTEPVVEEPVVEETVVEEPVVEEPTVEDRIKDIEGRISGLEKSLDEMYNMIVEVIDRQRKPEDEIREEVREEVREEIVEQMSAVTPTAEPVHVQNSEVHATTMAERIMELRKKSK